MTGDSKIKNILGNEYMIPVSIYDIAFKNKVYVLISKGNT